MRAIQEGHPELLAILFERYHDRAYGLCYGMTGSRSDSEDLVHETFMRVLRYAKSFEARSTFASWFFQIARNVCYDHFEARRRAQDAVDAVAAEREARRLETPEGDRMVTLRAALDRLPPEQREVLVLSRFEGLRYAEIGEICGAKEGTVRVRAHRALNALRRIVRSMEGTP